MGFLPSCSQERSSHALQSFDGIAVSVCFIEVLTKTSGQHFARAFVSRQGTYSVGSS